MSDALLTQSQRDLRHEVRAFVRKDVPRQLLLDMDAEQVLGGIGYTSVYPVERLLRDARLQMIWTGPSEVMTLIIQDEYYREMGAGAAGLRDVEADAAAADQAGEKHYGDAGAQS